MGLALSRSVDHFELGRHEDICTECVSKLPPADKLNQTGKLTGKRIYKNYTPHGAVICLCQDCLAELAKGIKR